MKECTSCQRCFPDEAERCAADNAPLLFTIGVSPVLDSRYQLERRLGQGGMGAVYKARHVFLKTEHAIKVILPNLVGSDPMLGTRFRQEAMAAAAIRHKNIVAVTDFGMVDGALPYLVMEFIKGYSLHDLIKQGKLPLAHAVELMEAIAAGVGAAHRRGIVHRDLKPLNIMIREGVPTDEGVKVLDFGLAKIKSSDLLGSFVVAQTAGIIGSPYYMAPEQWSEEEPDQRADIYSLGVILYQMITGSVPFNGPSLPAIMRKHLTGQPPTFTSMGVHVPPAVEAVIHHAIEKMPDQRPESLDEFICELREAAAQQQLGNYSPPDKVDPQAVTLVELPSGAGGNRAEASPGGLRDVLEQVVADAHRLEQESPELTAREVAAATTEVRKPAGARPKKAPAKKPREPKRRVTADLVREEAAQAEAATAAAAELARAEAAQAEADRAAAQAEAEAQHRRAAEAEGQRQRAAEAARLAAEEHARSESPTLAQPAVTPLANDVREPVRLPPPPVPQPAVVSQAPPVSAAAMTPPQPALATTQTFTDSSYSASGQQSLWQTSLSSFYTSATGFAATRKPSVLLAIGGVVVLCIFLLGAGGASLFVWLRDPATSSAPESTKAKSAKADMVVMAGGTFQMGRSDVSLENLGEAFQYPAHGVAVKPFDMDKTEVTNADYAEFVRQTKHAAPDKWLNGAPPAGQERWPVTYVSFDDAQAFATWRSQRDGVSYRLPTEEEWEFAARGGEQNLLYPWGRQWRDGAANVGASGPQPVGSYPQGASRDGVLDLLGNVWEWTASKNSIYPGNKAAQLEDHDTIIIRGGGYSSKSGEGAITATTRTAIPASTKRETLGFRLVRSAS